MMKTRLAQEELGRFGSQAAKGYFNERIKNYDTVKMHLMLNAFVAGFYAGARHAETCDGNQDPRPLWRRWFFLWEHWPSVLEHSQKMANQYLASFPSLSSEDGSLIRSAAGMAFSRGYHFRVEREHQNVSQGLTGRSKAGGASGAPLEHGGQASLRPKGV